MLCEPAEPERWSHWSAPANNNLFLHILGAGLDETAGRTNTFRPAPRAPPVNRAHEPGPRECYRGSAFPCAAESPPADLARRSIKIIRLHLLPNAVPIRCGHRETPSRRSRSCLSQERPHALNSSGCPVGLRSPVLPERYPGAPTGVPEAPRRTQSSAMRKTPATSTATPSGRDPIPTAARV